MAGPGMSDEDVLVLLSATRDELSAAPRPEQELHGGGEQAAIEALSTPRDGIVYNSNMQDIEPEHELPARKRRNSESENEPRKRHRSSSLSIPSVHNGAEKDTTMADVFTADAVMDTSAQTEAMDVEAAILDELPFDATNLTEAALQQVLDMMQPFTDLTNIGNLPNHNSYEASSPLHDGSNSSQGSSPLLEPDPQTRSMYTTPGLSFDLSSIPQDRDEMMLWIARQVKAIGEQGGMTLKDMIETDPEKLAEQQRVREENRERKRRWREGNADRNKDNDLRCRVSKRANKIYGFANTPAKQSWMDEEFCKRRAKREAKDRAKSHDVEDGDRFSGNPTGQLLADVFSGGEGAAESVRKILKGGIDLEALNEALMAMAGDENVMKTVANFLAASEMEELDGVEGGQSSSAVQTKKKPYSQVATGSIAETDLTSGAEEYQPAHTQNEVQFQDAQVGSVLDDENESNETMEDVGLLSGLGVEGMELLSSLEAEDLETLQALTAQLAESGQEIDLLQLLQNMNGGTTEHFNSAIPAAVEDVQLDDAQINTIEVEDTQSVKAEGAADVAESGQEIDLLQLLQSLGEGMNHIVEGFVPHEASKNGEAGEIDVTSEVVESITEPSVRPEVSTAVVKEVSEQGPGTDTEPEKRVVKAPHTKLASPVAPTPTTPPTPSRQKLPYTGGLFLPTPPPPKAVEEVHTLPKTPEEAVEEIFRKEPVTEEQNVEQTLDTSLLDLIPGLDFSQFGDMDASQVADLDQSQLEALIAMVGQALEANGEDPGIDLSTFTADGEQIDPQALDDILAQINASTNLLHEPQDYGEVTDCTPPSEEQSIEDILGEHSQTLDALHQQIKDIASANGVDINDDENSPTDQPADIASAFLQALLQNALSQDKQSSGYMQPSYGDSRSNVVQYMPHNQPLVSVHQQHRGGTTSVFPVNPSSDGPSGDGISGGRRVRKGEMTALEMAAGKLLKPPVYIPRPAMTTLSTTMTTATGVNIAGVSFGRMEVESERQRKVKAMGFPPMLAGMKNVVG